MTVHHLDAPTAEFASYGAAYKKLEEVAVRLQRAGPVDVDTLVADVALAARAHAFCRARIDQIVRTLDSDLAGPAAPDQPEAKPAREPWDEPF